MNITRRGFMKVLGAATALVSVPSLARYVEKSVVPVTTRHDWIEDYGSYIHIRIPAGKSIGNLVLPKPTIVEFGENSVLRSCEVSGYMNLYGLGRSWAFHDSYIDGSQMVVENDPDRAVIVVPNTGACGLLNGLNIQCNGKGSAIRMDNKHSV